LIARITKFIILEVIPVRLTLMLNNIEFIKKQTFVWVKALFYVMFLLSNRLFIMRSILRSFNITFVALIYFCESFKFYLKIAINSNNWNSIKFIDITKAFLLYFYLCTKDMRFNWNWIWIDFIVNWKNFWHVSSLTPDTH
jgi:hypothetical protein